GRSLRATRISGDGRRALRRPRRRPLSRADRRDEATVRPARGRGVDPGMDFRISDEQRRLQADCRRLAADFATRAAQHDRDASHPLENYEVLRKAGLYALNIPAELGGGGVGLLGYSLAAEELAQGCASTALSFNMHLSVVGPMMESPLVPRATKERLAKMVVHEGKLIGGNFSEPTTSGLV